MMGICFNHTSDEEHACLKENANVTTETEEEEVRMLAVEGVIHCVVLLAYYHVTWRSLLRGFRLNPGYSARIFGSTGWDEEHEE